MGKWFKEFKRQGGGFGREFKRQVGMFTFGKSHNHGSRGKHHPKCSSTHRRYCGGKRR
jgi:hypothetical protein